MQIYIKPFPGRVFTANGLFKVNEDDNIFSGIQAKLIDKGIKADTLDRYVKGNLDALVSIDTPMPWELSYWKHIIRNRNRTLLLVFESPVFAPFSHNKWLIKKLARKIYTWNDTLVDNKKIVKFNLPYVKKALTRTKKDNMNRKLICLINSNKHIPSALTLVNKDWKELYSERLKAIRFFEEHCGEQFALFGKNWNKRRRFNIKDLVMGPEKFPSYRGPIPKKLHSKINVLANYKFSVCYENCIAPGYISEKILDCFVSGSVPIYYGAPNISDFIPEDSYIDFRKFKSYSKLLSYISDLPESKYKSYVRAGRRFMNSKEFKNNWSADAFEKMLVNAIRDITSHQPSIYDKILV